MSEFVLRGSELVVTRRNTRILDSVSIRIPADSTLLIQGPSGAGKTTLFNVLGLLEPPEDGSLHVRGKETARLSDRQRATLRREALGFVFQDFQLIDDLTAWENAILPQEHTNSRDTEWMETLFDRLNISDLMTQYPPTLSGGEKQRVAIARALTNKPDIVLADEPTGQLDPDTAARVMDLLFQTKAATETALVVISHDPQLASEFEDRRYLENGQLLTDTDHADIQRPSS